MKLIVSITFYFLNVANRKLEITYVAHFIFRLDIATLGHGAMGYLNYIQG